ncbi:MAG: DUF2961 domain-containing protein [Allomuricauda sp.]
MGSISVYAQSKLSYPDLVSRLYDFEALAKLPGEGERTMNFSSYDRSSTYDSLTNSYLKWNANSDGNGFIRKEGDEMVIFEADGPGVIWRIWSALAKEGHIKIYMDGEQTPSEDKPFRELFEKFEDEYPPLNFPNLVMTLSRGRNFYIPMPFQKHCKITMMGDWGNYYHIMYSKLPEGSKLEGSFDGTYSNEGKIALAKADRVLENRGYERKIYPKEQMERLEFEIGPGEKKKITELLGSRAITRLELTVQDEDQTSGFLGDLWFNFSWDDKHISAVHSPIGMFFGMGQSLAHYRGMPVGVMGNTLYSNWYMPFLQKGTLVLENTGNQPYKLSFKVFHHGVEQQKDDFLYFNSKWHGDDSNMDDKPVDPSFTQDTGREIDWPMIAVKGTGRFCGVTLHIANFWEEPKEKPSSWWYGIGGEKTIDWWWGEGDEKFFVDGEKFPSTYGTGSEDYIGYAWSAEPPFPTFQSAFASQPTTPLTGKGHTVVNRFHIADNVPFSESFEAYIERYKGRKWGDENKNICEYDVVVYYYLK